MSLAPVQQSVDQWITAHGGYWDEMSMLARLVEDVGDLARQYNVRYGKKRASEADAERSVEEELGDVLFNLVCMANQQGVDLDHALASTLKKHQVRDLTRWG